MKGSMMMVTASVLALAWGTAKAEDTTVGSGATTTTVTDPKTGTSTTVTAPPGTTTTTTNPGYDDATNARTPGTLPSDPDAVPDSRKEPATTNIEINTPITPPPVNNTVVTPPPVAPVQPMAPAYSTAYPPAPPLRANPPAHTPLGAGLLLGGGVQDFTGSNIRSVTGTAGFWNARMVFGTRQIVGFEAAYVGSAQSIEMLGLDSDAMLLSNGAEGAVRVNLPMTRTSYSLVEPFGFVGAGWSRYHVANTPVNTSSVAPNDDILAVPYGAGVAFGYRGFMADARFTYRSTFYNDLLRTSGGRLDNWTAGGQVGFEF